MAVRGLCRALQDGGENLRIHALTSPPEASGLEHLFISSQVPGSPSRLGWSPTMKRELMRSVQAGDIVHNHSLWMMPNIYAGQAAVRKGAQLVISPHGTLAPWSLSRSRRIKKAMGWLGQNNALRQAAAFHVTADAELEHVRQLGFRQPVAVVPHGVEILDRVTESAVGSDSKRKEVLFLSRLHPTKGLELLLHVWKEIELRYPQVSLKIAGPDEGGYGAEMCKLAIELGLLNVEFVGALTGDEKTRAFREAAVYVLPSQSENFAFTVAEALSASTPAIVTRGAPWKGLEDHGCGWWIERTKDALREALVEALETQDEELKKMGERGRAWIQRDFSWNAIAEQMTTFYRWLSGTGGGCPDFVNS
ncbi:glycosyltransferase [Akkermansiaceae bacterium]|nr:glycosyltransferase [Akkermansiaceae bacterium]